MILGESGDGKVVELGGVEGEEDGAGSTIGEKNELKRKKKTN